MQTILVVREFDQFSRILSENNFPVINCPTIRVIELENLNDFEHKLSALNNYDGIFLTSIYATKIFQRKLNEDKSSFNGKIYVLGKRSFDVLKDTVLDLFFDETSNTAIEMLSKIAPEELKNKRFLFVRGDHSLNVIADFLKDRADLDETIVYKTEKRNVVINEISEIQTKIEHKSICCACFFSPSAAKSFIEQFGAEILHQTKITTIGKTTAEYFERQNITIDFVSPKPDAESYAVELSRFLQKLQQ